MMTAGAREDAGDAIGRLLAPAAAYVSRARHARMFHPDGSTFIARVEPLSMESSLASIGRLLGGPALARFSGALWRREFEHLDVLGVALRFQRVASSSPVALASDQDLLFATIRSPFTMPFAAFTTNPHDFTANRYWAVSPFEVPGVGRVKFRLSPRSRGRSATVPREERLRSIVASEVSSWNLEVRRTFTPSWTPVARLFLERVAIIDQATLRFSPFNSGREIVPRGLVHAMRRATYAASQAARPWLTDASDSPDGSPRQSEPSPRPASSE